MDRASRQLALAAVAALASTTSLAAPVSINGVIGAEWIGAPSVTVTHDALAPTSNFGTPGSTTAGAGYSIRMRADAGYVYVAVQITSDAGASAGNFANLYFDTNPGTGSDLGIEVTNGTYFIPGGPGGFDATPFVTYDATSNPGTIELAIDNSFFTSGLQGSPAASTQVQLRLSQSFGYSVAGGPSYGTDRLGTVTLQAAAAVPEPDALSLALASLGALGVTARRRIAH